MMIIEQIKLKEAEQRMALLKAAQERQAYEKLKEKHKEEYDELEAEEERKLIDELATIKFARRMQEEAIEREVEEREKLEAMREEWEAREAE
jgi:ribosomal protein L15